MHNWRLLILAFLAVLQPIASFTERNLVDGREQCCERNSLVRDGRLSHGYRHSKLPEDRLSQAEIREDRRYELRRDSSGLQIPPGRRLVDFRTEREASRFSPDTSARLVRAAFRRDSSEARRERLSTLRDERERRVRDSHRYSRHVNKEQWEGEAYQMRSRQADDRLHDRDFRESLRINRNRAISEERGIHERREAREILQRARIDIARREVSDGRQDRRVARERVQERERFDTRLQNDNRERQFLNRRTREAANERRIRSVDGARSKSVRDARNNNRVAIDRFDNRREQRDENRASRDRAVSFRRESRERRETQEQSRNIMSRRIEPQSESRRESRGHERRVRSNSREAIETRRVDSRRVTDRESGHGMERSERVAVDRRENRDNRREIRMDRNFNTKARDLSHSRITYRNSKSLESDARFRSNGEFYRSREMFASVREKSQPEINTSPNWQYVIYTLQGIYLCGILMNMLSQKESHKKTRYVSWLEAPHSLIKVD